MPRPCWNACGKPGVCGRAGCGIVWACFVGPGPGAWCGAVEASAPQLEVGQADIDLVTGSPTNRGQPAPQKGPHSVSDTHPDTWQGLRLAASVPDPLANCAFPVSMGAGLVPGSERGLGVGGLPQALHPFSRQDPCLVPTGPLRPRPPEVGPSRISPVGPDGSWIEWSCPSGFWPLAHMPCDLAGPTAPWCPSSAGGEGWAHWRQEWEQSLREGLGCWVSGLPPASNGAGTGWASPWSFHAIPGLRVAHLPTSLLSCILPPLGQLGPVLSPALHLTREKTGPD